METSVRTLDRYIPQYSVAFSDYNDRVKAPLNREENFRKLKRALDRNLNAQDVRERVHNVICNAKPGHGQECQHRLYKETVKRAITSDMLWNNIPPGDYKGTKLQWIEHCKN